jgi:Transcription factor WhiB
VRVREAGHAMRYRHLVRRVRSPDPREEGSSVSAARPGNLRTGREGRSAAKAARAVALAELLAQDPDLTQAHAAWRLGITRRTVQRLAAEARTEGTLMTAREPQAMARVQDVTAPQMKGAACKGSDLHHGPEGESAAGRESRVTAAKATCAGCGVRPGCLQYALERPEPDGVWGGLDEFERRELRREAAA